MSLTFRRLSWLSLMVAIVLAAFISAPAHASIIAAATPAASLSPTSSAIPNDYVVIAQLNLWYFGPGCYGGFEASNCSGKRTTPLTPALGATYISSDPKVIQQQIDWAADYGVDAFSLEWTTPRGIGHSLEDNIDDAFLKAPNLGRIRWCIFDDFVLRMDQDPNTPVLSDDRSTPGALLLEYVAIQRQRCRSGQRRESSSESAWVRRVSRR